MVACATCLFGGITCVWVFVVSYLTCVGLTFTWYLLVFGAFLLFFLLAFLGWGYCCFVLVFCVYQSCLLFCGLCIYFCLLDGFICCLGELTRWLGGLLCFLWICTLGLIGLLGSDVCCGVYIRFIVLCGFWYLFWVVCFVSWFWLLGWLKAAMLTSLLIVFVLLLFVFTCFVICFGCYCLFSFGFYFAFDLMFSDLNWFVIVMIS